MLRRPAVLSSMGLAIVLATAFGLLFPTNGGPSVRAATVLEKLSKQVTGNDVIEARLDRVEIEELEIDGLVALAEKALAGDLQVTVNEGDGKLEVDVAFGITEDSGWVLVRKLRLPDAEAQVFVDMFLPAGQETLLLLPAAVIQSKLGQLGGGLAHVRQMAGGHMADVVKVLLNSDSAAASKTERLADGTVLLSIDLKDEEAIESFMRAVTRSMGKDVPADLKAEDHDLDELLGASFTIVYDPAVETVRSFSVSGIHDIKGVISISLHGGTIAPAMLDSAHVAKPGTRTLDLEGLLNSVDGLHNLLKHD